MQVRTDGVPYRESAGIESKALNKCSSSKGCGVLRFHYGPIVCASLFSHTLLLIVCSDIAEKTAAPITRTTLRANGPVSRGTHGRERHRYAIAWPGKFGIDLMMAVDGICVDAVADSGRNPLSKHQIQPECGQRAG